MREELLAQLSYQDHGKVPTRFSWCTNEMNHMTWIPAEERVVVTDDGTSGCCRALRPVQKDVDLDEVCYAEVHIAHKSSI